MRALLALLCLVSTVGCSAAGPDDGHLDSGTGGGAMAGSGGQAVGQGGASGGETASSGGATSGGSSTGGATSGGAAPQGGAAVSGGASTTSGGQATSGGAVSSGGSSTGGSATSGGVAGGPVASGGSGGSAGAGGDPLAPYPAPACPGYMALRSGGPGTCIGLRGRFDLTIPPDFPGGVPVDCNYKTARTCSSVTDVGQFKAGAAVVYYRETGSGTTAVKVLRAEVGADGKCPYECEAP